MVVFKHGLAFIKDGRLLAVKKKGLDVLLVPGGKPKPGESFRDTLAREINEELNGRVSEKSLEFFGTFKDMRPEKEELIHIELYLGQIHGSLKPSSEIEKLVWVDSRTDKSKLSPIFRNKILPALVQEGYVK
jgi:8-oxo-dGTP diphosphatase